MGSVALEQQFGTPIDKSLIALLITDQTEKVIEKLCTLEGKVYYNESINFKGDNILHYACAKNNIKLV
jgi:hypothetical protein